MTWRKYVHLFWVIWCGAIAVADIALGHPGWATILIACALLNLVAGWPRAIARLVFLPQRLRTEREWIRTKSQLSSSDSRLDRDKIWVAYMANCFIADGLPDHLVKYHAMHILGRLRSRHDVFIDDIIAERVIDERLSQRKEKS